MSNSDQRSARRMAKSFALLSAEINMQFVKTTYTEQTRQRLIAYAEQCMSDAGWSQESIDYVTGVLS